MQRRGSDDDDESGAAASWRARARAERERSGLHESEGRANLRNGERGSRVEELTISPDAKPIDITRIMPSLYGGSAHVRRTGTSRRASSSRST
jgi:hypothetical protein